MAYVNRVLSDQERGGFYAHQDADMGPGDDGAYYTWTVQEVKTALSKEEVEVILRYYDIDEQGEMPGTLGRNVLRVATTPEGIARELALSLQEVKALITRGNAHLLEARGKRKMPFVDRTLNRAGSGGDPRRDLRAAGSPLIKALPDRRESLLLPPYIIREPGRKVLPRQLLHDNGLGLLLGGHLGL